MAVKIRDKPRQDMLLGCRHEHRQQVSHTPCFAHTAGLRLIMM